MRIFLIVLGLIALATLAFQGWYVFSYLLDSFPEGVTPRGDLFIINLIFGIVNVFNVTWISAALWESVRD